MIIVYRLTKTGKGVAMLGLVRNVPLIVFGPVAGVFVDRLAKRKLLAGCNLFFGAICIALAFSRALWQVLAMVFLYMMCWTLYKPTRYATIPTLVSSQFILAANSFLMTVDEVVGILGSSAAALLSIRGAQYSYWVTASTMLAASTILWFGLRPLAKSAGSSPTFRQGSQFNLFADCAAGWKYLRGHRLLSPLMWVVAVVWLSLGMFMSVQIIYVVKGLRLPDYYYGYLGSIQSAGSIMGFLISPFIVHKLGITKWKTFYAGYVLAGGVAIVVALSHDKWLSATSILLFAIGAGVANSIEEAMEQELPNEGFRGKVISFISTIGTLGYLLGITAGPLNCDIVGVRSVILISAGLLFVTSAVIRMFLNERAVALSLGEEGCIAC